MKLRTFAALAATLALAGCGTVVRGTTEKVTINSEPQGAVISTDIGLGCPAAPCTLEVKRKTEFTAYAEKPGYQRGSLRIGTKVSGGGAAGMAGNIVLGGIIGAGVDAASGATLDHYPNPATVVLGVNSDPTTVNKPAPPKPPRSKPKIVPVS